MQPTALHCTSTLDDIIWRIRGFRPPSWTMRTLLSAGNPLAFPAGQVEGDPTIDGKVAQRGTSSSLDFNVVTPEEGQDGLEGLMIDGADVCDQLSTRILRATGAACPRPNAPRSVISAKVKLALRWRSILSEATKVHRARRGSPEKKSVSPRYSSSVWFETKWCERERTFSRYCRRLATASRSSSARTCSYSPLRALPGPSQQATGK